MLNIGSKARVWKINTIANIDPWLNLYPKAYMNEEIIRGILLGLWREAIHDLDRCWCISDTCLDSLLFWSCSVQNRQFFTTLLGNQC